MMEIAQLDVLSLHELIAVLHQCTQHLARIQDHDDEVGFYWEVLLKAQRARDYLLYEWYKHNGHYSIH